MRILLKGENRVNVSQSGAPLCSRPATVTKSQSQVLARPSRPSSIGARIRPLWPDSYHSSLPRPLSCSIPATQVFANLQTCRGRSHLRTFVHAIPLAWYTLPQIARGIVPSSSLFKHHFLTETFFLANNLPKLPPPATSA